MGVLNSDSKDLDCEDKELLGIPSLLMYDKE